MAQEDIRKQPITDKIFTKQDLEEARIEGRREVVEWVRKNGLVPIGRFRSPKREMVSTINEEEFQAKLKEWGIDYIGDFIVSGD